METRKVLNDEYRSKSVNLRKTGDVNYNNQFWNESIEDFEKAILTRYEIEESELTADDYSFLADCYNNEGLSFSEVNKKGLEIEAYKAAIEMYAKIEASKRDFFYYDNLINYFYYNLLYTYVETNDKQSIHQSYDELATQIELAKTIPRIDTPSLILDLIKLNQNIAKLLYEKKEINDTEEFILRGINLNDQLNKSINYIFDSERNDELSKLYMMLADVSRDKKMPTHDTIIAYQAAIDALKQIDCTRWTDEYYRNRSKTHRKLALTYIAYENEHGCTDKEISAATQACHDAMDWNLNILKREPNDQNELENCHRIIAELEQIDRKHRVQAQKNEPATVKKDANMHFGSTHTMFNDKSNQSMVVPNQSLMQDHQSRYTP